MSHKESEIGKISAREGILLVLHEVEKEKAYANLQISKLLAEQDFSPQDSRFITEIVYGTIRRQAALDYILDKLISRGISSLPRHILLILRLSLYQLIYLDKIPASAAVNEAVKLAKKYGHQGTASLVNAVLRNYLRKKDDPELQLPTLADGAEDYLSITLSHPRWLIQYLLQEWPVKDIVEYCLFNNQQNGVMIRTNTLQIKREQLLNQLAEEGIEAQEGTFAPESIYLPTPGRIFQNKLFHKGFFQAQDEGSMLVAHALSPAPGSKVLDLCAAPGGKTTHLAQLMNNQGLIKAFDIHEHKIKLIEDNCRRLGIKIVEAKQGDSNNLGSEYENWADYLLLDAPCSGLGVLGRRPDARWRKSWQDIEDMRNLSYRLLHKAADYLAPGGRMIFSTCTITHEENIDNLLAFLRERKDISLEPLTELLPYAQNPQDTALLQKGVWQLLPQVHHIEGFFIARLRKKGGGKSDGGK